MVPPGKGSVMGRGGPTCLPRPSGPPAPPFPFTCLCTAPEESKVLLPPSRSRIGHWGKTARFKTQLWLRAVAKNKTIVVGHKAICFCPFNWRKVVLPGDISSDPVFRAHVYAIWKILAWTE